MTVSNTTACWYKVSVTREKGLIAQVNIVKLFKNFLILFVSNWASHEKTFTVEAALDGSTYLTRFPPCNKTTNVALSYTRD
jgi:hypothetical protein